MKATIVVCLLGAVFSNPILQINILDATVTPLRGDMLEEIVRQTHTSFQTDEPVWQTSTPLRGDMLEEIVRQTHTQIFQTDEPVRQTSTPQTLALSSSSSESSEESDESDPDSSPENTSEDTTSEESDGNLMEMRDPDGNGDMRDDSRGEQNIPRKWIQLFKINLRSEEDTSEETEEDTSEETEEDTSEETEEAESPESDSDSEASDDSDGPQSMLSLCADGAENTGCNSHESSVEGEDNRMAWQRN